MSKRLIAVGRYKGSVQQPIHNSNNIKEPEFKEQDEQSKPFFYEVRNGQLIKRAF